MAERITGVVKWFNGEKGYGFATPDDGSKDVFVHHTAILGEGYKNLNEGDRFEIIRFSTEVEPLFDKLVEANARNRDQAEDFIKGLKPIGGTAIDDALKQALSLRSSRGEEAPAPRPAAGRTAAAAGRCAAPASRPAASSESREG